MTASEISRNRTEFAWWHVVSLALFLIAFENVVAVLTGGELFASGWFGIVATLALLSALVTWAKLTRLGRKEIGVTTNGLLQGLLWGVVIAAIAAGFVLLVLLWGPGTGGSVRYTPFATMSVSTIIARALFWMPLTTALPEELAFRGVLLGLLRRRFTPFKAAALSAIPFALWHGITVFHTLGNTSLAASTFGWLIGSVGGFVAVFLGGLLFAFLRIRSGNLLTSFVAHWGFNAAILLGLYATSPHP